MTQKGLSLMEILVCVVVMGLFTIVAILGYQKAQQNSHQKATIVHLASYLRVSKLAIADLGFNPGNFEALGFQPEGDLYHRIIATDNNSERLPLTQPSNKFCFSTEKCNTTCYGGTSVKMLESKARGCCCSLSLSDQWQEIHHTYQIHKTSVVEDHKFKVYAFSNKLNNYLCVNEYDIFVQECQEPE